MKIREEIEKLEIHRHPYQPGYLTTDKFLRKSDILWVLDEHLGELVVEYTNEKHKAITWPVLAYPGDTIIIYVRRKNESSS